MGISFGKLFYQFLWISQGYPKPPKVIQDMSLKNNKSPKFVVSAAMSYPSPSSPGPTNELWSSVSRQGNKNHPQKRQTINGACKVSQNLQDSVTLNWVSEKNCYFKKCHGIFLSRNTITALGKSVAWIRSVIILTMVYRCAKFGWFLNPRNDKFRSCDM